MKQLVIKIFAISALATLAACADDDSAKPNLFCPNVAVLQQTSQLDAFLPSRPDVSGLITEALITGVAGSCDLAAKKQLLKVTFKIGFDASNGPANHFEPLELPYFVSVVDGEQIASKSLYKIPISFEGNLSSAAAASPTMTVELPNVPESARVQVLVGFQLTPEQLVYAQDHPAR
jgi:hypothetical protein